MRHGVLPLGEMKRKGWWRLISIFLEHDLFGKPVPTFPDHAHVLRCGSTRSRKPSPSRLKQNTAIISAPPGKKAIHHSPEMMLVAPSATMIPHSGVGGLTPSPMNDSPAALRMA